MKIATLDSNQLESSILQRIIVDAGHECIAFFSGLSLLDALHYQRFDLLILEWHFPDMEARDVIKAIRSGASKNMMVMFLTNRMQESDVVRGLKAGANDYLVKPVRTSELLLRIHALSKIATQAAFVQMKAAWRMPELLGLGFYRFDLMQGLAFVRGDLIDLQPKEFDIAVLLFSHFGQVLTRERIMNEIWGRTLIMSSRTLDTHMSRVRTKLQLNSVNNVRLVTVYTIGYRLDVC
jgi:DNA-binding response OmpR family regulator